MSYPVSYKSKGKREITRNVDVSNIKYVRISVAMEFVE